VLGNFCSSTHRGTLCGGSDLYLGMGSIFDWGKMRALQLIDHMGYGGAPVAVSNITKRLLDKGIDVRVCALRKNNIPVKLSCSSYVLNSGRYSILRAGLALRRLCKEKEIDLIHAHLTHSMGIACLFSKVPVIAHEHGAVLGKGFWCKLHRKMYEKFHPAHTIACSNVLRDKIKSLGVEKVTTVGNPIDLDAFEYNQTKPYFKRFFRKILNYDYSCFVVGYLGRLASNKNLDSLIGCAAWLKIRKHLLHGDRKFRFLMVGDGNYRNMMEKLIKRQNLEDMFKFYGQTEKPGRIVQAFDCALQVAERGSFGQAVLELMAARIPVVVPPVGAFSEIIEDRVNGFIAEDTGGKALADAVLTVANNDCGGILERAKQTAKRFEGEKQIQEIIRIYEDVL